MQNKRLIEKLELIASKRGPDSPQAEELKRQLAAGAPAEAPKDVKDAKDATEKPRKQEKVHND